MLKVTDKQFWIHPTLKSNLDILKEQVEKHDWDNIILIDGQEGSGKSTFGASMCYYLAYNEHKGISTFSIDNIFWTPEQLEKCILKAKPGDALLGDEFVLMGLGTQTMTQMFNILIQYFTTIRKKRLHIILVIPYFFMVATYFAVARTRCLIHVTCREGFTRGWFKFYNYAQKRYLYFEGKKKYWGYPKKCDYSFIGEHRVKSWSEIGIDKADYEKRKDEAINSILKPKKKDDKYKEMFYYLVGFIKERKKIEWKQMPVYLKLGLTWQGLQRGYSRYKDKAIDKQLDEAEKKQKEFRMPGNERIRDSM